jgi:hypothetical protein
VVRKLTPVALVSLLVLAACGTQGAAPIEDPEEILAQSVEAMAGVDSVHFVVALDGDVNVPEMGGALSLNGTELEGSLAMDGSAGQFTFAMPALLGLTGEMRLVDGEGFVKTSMTGPLWMRQPIAEGEGDPIAQAADPQAALEELREFLAEDGVTLEKLDDVECGESTCYHLRLDIDGEVFLNADEAASAAPEVLDALGAAGMTFDLEIDTETLHMTGVSTAFENEEMGSLELSFTFDGFGDPVDVEAPPSDEVTDDAGGFPLP